MYGTMSVEVLERRREEMRREAELNRLKKVLQANRRPTVTRWASTVAWELARAAGVLRKFFDTPKNAD